MKCKIMWRSLFYLLAVIAVTHSNVIPDSAPEKGGQFNIYHLYTRQNPNEPMVLRLTASSVQNSYFDPNRDTAVIVHGHRANAFNSLNPSVKDGFLRSYDANVIVVDWAVFAGQSYSNAVNSVPSIGLGIANFLTFLKQFNLQLNKVHLVGFDLGAHVVGHAGRNLDGQVARITGLSASASRWGSNSGRLNSNDAVFVEVIHTDGGITGNSIGTNIGHVDFYPNGGTNQPGCLLNGCDHERAWQLFASSLIYNHFVARRCTSSMQLSLNSCRGETLYMGNGDMAKPGYTPGTYRVNTDSRYPY